MSKVFTTRYRRVMEKKTRASDIRDAKALEKAEAESEYLKPVPPLLITLHQDLGKLPAGISIQFPHEVAIILIHRGLGEAVPIGDFAVLPDLLIEEDDMQHVGFDLWSAEAVAA
jgi:hypothetical protein